MRRNELLLTAIVMMVFVASRLYSEAKPKIKAEIMNCHDGDTCHVKVQDGLWFNVRLAGIDAPEVNNKRKKNFEQPFGSDSRDYLNDQLRGKQVELVQMDLDAYNRPVVEVYIGERNINQEMVAKGFAEVYRGKVKRLDQASYINIEESAKKQKVGIWQQANYVSPAEYRRIQKDKEKNK